MESVSDRAARVILALEWEHVDRDRGLLLLPDGKTGVKTVIINQPAADLLANLPRHDDNPYVLPGDLPGKARIDHLKRPWNRVRE